MCINNQTKGKLKLKTYVLKSAQINYYTDVRIKKNEI